MEVSSLDVGIGLQLGVHFAHILYGLLSDLSERISILTCESKNEN